MTNKAPYNFGDFVLDTLKDNPTVHMFAKECGLKLNDAYKIQQLHTELWQAMIKSPPTIIKEPEVELPTTIIDTGYRQVKLTIPREWDRYARRCILAADGGHMEEAWIAMWIGLGEIIWLQTKVRKK
jgi:hypothetical protein